MASLVDEDTASQFNDIVPRILSHMKTFSFFVYYEESHLGQGDSALNLEKLSFKLREDKGSQAEKYAQNNKNVQLSFIDMDNDMDLSNSLHDLKVCAQDIKTRLVFYASESSMLNFILKARVFNISIDTIPICIYTRAIHPDFSAFLGWGQPNLTIHSFLSLSSVEKQIRNWVESPTEKVDIWSVDIQVAEEGGFIQKINRGANDPDLSSQKTHREFFVSNMSVGFHPQLLIDYEQRKSKKSSLLNKFIYSFQGFKKFCCVGESGMREATGVVKIEFEDEKGSHEILKELREHEGEDEINYMKSKESRNKRKVLSLVLSNIGQFLGERMKGRFQSRMNDQKLEILSYQSINDCSSLASVSGRISMNFEQQHPVFLQVNDSCYQLTRPVSLRVESHGKAKVIINKETLSC